MKRRRPIRRALAWGLFLLCMGYGLASAQAAQKPASTRKAASDKASPLSKAQAALAKGDLQGAEDGAWQVLAASPDNEDGLTLLGIIRGQQQRYAEAETLFAKVVKLNPTSPAARQNLANALLAQDKVEEAVAQYKEAESRAPKSVEIKVNLARLYSDRGKFDLALSTLQSIPTSAFPPAAVPVEAASLIGLGREGEAAGLAGKVANSLPLTMELAEVFLRGNLADAALRTLKSVAATKDLPARYYYLEGQALLSKAQGEDAEAALRHALELDPKSVETLVALAEISAMKRQHDESVKFLQQAHELAPDAIPLLRHLVIESEAAGLASAAARAARELAQKSPDNLDDLYLASAAMLQGGDTVDALAALKSYTAQRSDDPNGWLALGMACLTQKRYDDARSALERSAQLAPNRAETEYQLGVLAVEESKRDEGIQHFEKALRIDPKHAASLAKLGGLYLQSGDLDKAQQALTQSLAVAPNVPDTEYKLAMTLSKMGKTAEAREHMQRFQKLKQSLEAKTQGDPAR